MTEPQSNDAPKTLSQIAEAVSQAKLIYDEHAAIAANGAGVLNRSQGPCDCPICQVFRLIAHAEAKGGFLDLRELRADLAAAHARIGELERERDTRLLWKEQDNESDSIVASCTCLTKAPEIEFHKLGCKYRLIRERDEVRQQLRDQVRRNREGYEASRKRMDELEQQLEAVRKDKERLASVVTLAQDAADSTNLVDAIQVLRARIEELEAALEKYGVHTLNCANGCSCGLTAALHPDAPQP